MKKLVMFFVILLGILGSCKKSDLLPVPVDSEAIQAQLIQVSTPSKEVFQSVILSEKSGSLQPSLVEVFPLEQRTYEVYEDHCIKNFVYYDINSDGYRDKFLGFGQRFEIKNGVVDTTHFVLNYQVGCPYSRYFYLENNPDVSQIVYHFRFKSGLQFAYYGSTGTIKLPPLAGGQWQLDINFYDGDMTQNYKSKLIDFYSVDNVVKLIFDVKKENTVCYLELTKQFTEGAYLVEAEKYANDNYEYFTCRMISDEITPEKLYFPLSFEPNGFVICKRANGCNYYEVKIGSYSTVDGKPIYVPK